MADAFGQDAFAIHPLGLAHLFLIRLDLRHETADLGVCHAAGRVGCDRFAQLTRAQFHVVEIGDGLAQFVGQVGQHRLELSERDAGVTGILGRDSLESQCVTDEHRHAPPLLAVGPVTLARGALRKEVQHLAVDVGFSGRHELFADVPRHAVDVVLQQIHILEDGLVDALQDIIVRTVGDDPEGIVDQSVP